MDSLIYSLFISLAVRVSVITVFVFIIKLVIRHKLNAFTNCIMWGVIFVQTLFCLGNIKIPSKTSIYNTISTIPINNSGQSLNGFYNLQNLIAIVYFSGVIITVIWYVSVFCIHIFKTNRLSNIDDKEILELFAFSKKRLNVKSNIKLKYGAYAYTFFNAIIILDGYSADEQQHIILHELCHYKHKDNIKLWLGVFVVCINWFNPLVWVAFKMFRNDVEMYCDDSVLKLTDNASDYARVLIKTASDKTVFVPGVSGVANNTSEVAKRVKRIVFRKKEKTIWLIIAILSMFSISCMCLTNEISEAVNTKTDIKNVPEKAEEASDVAEVVASNEPTQVPMVTSEPVATKETVQPAAPTVNPTIKPTVKPAIKTKNNTYEPVSVAEEQNVISQVTTPVSKKETIQMATESNTSSTSDLGEIQSVSANGEKETYKLEDGKTAVLQYDEGELQTGYIINSGE